MNGNELVKQTLDHIPQANSNAKRIVGLVKEGGRITGYQLSDNSVVEKQQAVDMAKQGQIAGVGIAHRGDTEYLKSVPTAAKTTTSVTCPPFLQKPKDNSLTVSIPFWMLTVFSLFIAAHFMAISFSLSAVISFFTSSIITASFSSHSSLVLA